MHPVSMHTFILSRSLAQTFPGCCFASVHLQYDYVTVLATMYRDVPFHNVSLVGWTRLASGCPSLWLPLEWIKPQTRFPFFLHSLLPTV